MIPNKLYHLIPGEIVSPSSVGSGFTDRSYVEILKKVESFKEKSRLRKNVIRRNL